MKKYVLTETEKERERLKHFPNDVKRKPCALQCVNSAMTMYLRAAQLQNVSYQKCANIHIVKHL